MTSNPSPASATWGTKEGSEEVELFFEDNFNPTEHKPEFKKLDDSSEYLAVLEKRLAKIKNDPGVLKQLAERREQCMRSLLGGSGILTSSQISLDRAVGILTEESRASEVLRRIKPEQPLSVGEVVPIVKHDQLQTRLEEEEEQDNESTASR